MRPLLYDVFCGAGGATRGYQEAGFRVIGVDHVRQPHYCGDWFVQMDAFEFFERVQDGGYPQPDAWHCSPPCQGYSRMRHLPWLKGKQYPMLIDATRTALEATGLPWIIENVEGAPLRNGVTLCGLSFGLKVYRHRWFESNCVLLAPPHQKHAQVIGPGRMFNDRQSGNADGFISVVGKGPLGAAAMEISWMTRNELAQAIPPAYTRHLGEQLMLYCEVPAGHGEDV